MNQEGKVPNQSAVQVPFKAETRQILDILINSLYTDRDIFLRELISNASDALTRIDFEILTNRDVLDPGQDLGIWIIPDKEDRTLTVRDTGIGMSADELDENLGTIAHSGARDFIEAVQDHEQPLSEIIGQFGVGFYSAFMVAEWIRVTSRSYIPGKKGAEWYSDGLDSYRVSPAQKETRGTEVKIKLKEDCEEYLQENKIREVVRKHSDFVAFPIYVGDEKEQVNRQTAIWRQQPTEVSEEDYVKFYNQLTLDSKPPLAHTHVVVDAPVQVYSLLFVPANPDFGLFSARKEPGLELFSKKVLIQEYNKDLLPDYLNFIQGVVDSEDVPLNVSRETVQVSKVMSNLKRLVTSKAIDMIRGLADQNDNDYDLFWKTYSRYIKQGVATETRTPKKLYPLLRFRTTANPQGWKSLDDYIEGMKPDQEGIYYLIGEDTQSVLSSPHLDIVRHYNYEVILFTDPIDPFMLMKWDEYKEHSMINVATTDLEIPEGEQVSREGGEKLSEEENERLVQRFREILGEKIHDVRISRRLTGSPARLVDVEGEPQQELQRVYRMVDENYQMPKKILEINPKHPVMVGLSKLSVENQLSPMIVEQIFENTLLVEGLHPEPASMVSRIQQLIEKALE